MRKPRALKSDSGKIGTPDIRTTYQEIDVIANTNPVEAIRNEARSRVYADLLGNPSDGCTGDVISFAEWICEHHAAALTPAARDVLAERRRQVEVEGFTPERDDACNTRGEIPAAAGSYALHAFDHRIVYIPAWWPWPRAWWKPDTPRQMLVKAGALILAAIEQIDRRAAK